MMTETPRSALTARLPGRPRPPNRPPFAPARRYYDPGERIDAVVRAVDGSGPDPVPLRIVRKLGEGYAGQVYQAIDERSGETVAVKILKTESERRQRLRDGFYRLCFGGDYMPAIDEAALRYGLIWQLLVRRGARIELGDETVIPRPIGYFWDDRLAAFAEIHEFIHGRQALPSDPEKARRKRQFLESMVALATRLGADQLARQYEWWTLLAGGNAIERDDGSFCAIDWRPGIALPFCLPLSPGDLPIIWRNLRRGRTANFDAADFAQLDGFIADHADDFRDLLPLVDDLKRLDRRYRTGVRDATVARWEAEHQVDAAHARGLRRSRLAYRAHLLLAGIPRNTGLRLLSSSTYRTHVKQIVTDPGDRRAWFAANQAADLDRWRRQGQITERKAAELARKDWLYLLHKVFLAGTPIQFVADDEELRRELKVSFRPFAIVFHREKREEWFDERIEDGVEYRLLSAADAAKLRRDVREPRLQNFLWEAAGVNACIKVLTALATLSLLAAGETALALGSFLFSGGILRFVYAALHRLLREIPQAAWDRDLKAGLAALASIAIAPLKSIGTLYPLPELAITYPALAGFLTRYALVRAVRKIPVYGIEGGALEHYAYQAPLLVKGLPGRIAQSAAAPAGRLVRRRHVVDGTRPLVRLLSAGRPRRWPGGPERRSTPVSRPIAGETTEAGATGHRPETELAELTT